MGSDARLQRVHSLWHALVSLQTDEEVKLAITQYRFYMAPEDLSKLVTADAVDLVFKLLQVKPEARLTADQCLQHKWVRQNPEEIPDNPLPAPSNLRDALTVGEIKDLSSKDIHASQRCSMLLLGLYLQEMHIVICRRVIRPDYTSALLPITAPVFSYKSKGI